MRKFKRSEKQMWSYARRSKDLKKQGNWLRKIYERKRKLAERYGDTKTANYYKGVKSRVKGRLLKARKYGGIFAGGRAWVQATNDNFAEMVLNAKHSGGNGYDNHILILEKEGGNVIAYEGTELYDEIIEAKKKWFGSANGTVGDNNDR